MRRREENGTRDKSRDHGPFLHFFVVRAPLKDEYQRNDRDRADEEAREVEQKRSYGLSTDGLRDEGESPHNRGYEAEEKTDELSVLFHDLFLSRQRAGYQIKAMPKNILSMASFNRTCLVRCNYNTEYVRFQAVFSQNIPLRVRRNLSKIKPRVRNVKYVLYLYKK